MLPRDTILPGSITLPKDSKKELGKLISGGIILPKGTIFPEGITLRDGTNLPAGAVRGAALPGGITFPGGITLQATPFSQRAQSSHATLFS